MSGTSGAAQGRLAASFAGETELLAAVRAVRERGFQVHDVFTPYAVHGLDEALAAPRSRLPWVTLAGGLAGLTAAAGLQVWCAVVDWPLNVGGKPANSALAFLPISFELTILLGGLATAGAFFWRSGLGRRFEPRLAAPAVTDDALVLVLTLDGNSAEREEEAHELLRAAGAREVREIREIGEETAA
ncbi:MAG TPA: DUF3341 domain-containing protein [Thermoanaerobaculia bacterium]|nr:DUF3341 domain-containing protein [Thermoanaerobaculia bacterium]